MYRRLALLISTLILLSAPSRAHANARLVSVVPVDGGCLAGPTGPAVQAWDVQPGRTYRLRLEGVWECTGGGTAATLDVRVNSTSSGNTDAVAVQVAAGTYEFDFTMPANCVCTFPLFYCTSPGAANTGLRVLRADGESFQAHLRASTFGPGCTDPQPLLGGDCLAVPTRVSTWGAVKGIYR